MPPKSIKVPIVCAACGRTFLTKPSHADRRRSCSTACMGAMRTIRCRVPAKDRFWDKVDMDGPIPAHVPHLGPCWLWTASRTPNGYGKFSFVNREVIGAHVAAYILTYGELPAGKPWVLHHCDGGSIGCVRPSHLFAGNSEINERDKVAKGRQRRGDRAGMAKLTTVQIVEILTRWAAGGVTQRALAAEYGVSYQHMSLIVRRKTWTHIDP